MLAGHQFPNEFFFREAALAPQFCQTFAQVAQSSAQLLRIALLLHREVETNYAAVPPYGQRLATGQVAGGVIPELSHSYFSH